jgi:hypothetical protein
MEKFSEYERIFLLFRDSYASIRLIPDSMLLIELTLMRATSTKNEANKETISTKNVLTKGSITPKNKEENSPDSSFLRRQESHGQESSVEIKEVSDTKSFG